jgi:hypothetical protein
MTVTNVGHPGAGHIPPANRSYDKGTSHHIDPNHLPLAIFRKSCGKEECDCHQRHNKEAYEKFIHILQVSHQTSHKQMDTIPHKIRHKTEKYPAE